MCIVYVECRFIFVGVEMVLDGGVLGCDEEMGV